MSKSMKFDMESFLVFCYLLMEVVVGIGIDKLLLAYVSGYWDGIREIRYL